ncbi:hypothetical protein BH09PSE4_BH09PSE4_23200 [soil metagenome]
MRISGRKAAPIIDSDPPAHRHSRLMIRLLAEMQTNAAAAGIRVFDGNLDRSTIFIVIARAGGTLSALAIGDAVPDGRPAPKTITVNALAASLSRPFETMRRHVNALIADGLVARTSRGVSVPPEVMARPEILSLMQNHHDLLVRLIEDMANFGVPLPSARPHVAYDPQLGIAAAIDVLLTGLEFNAQRYDSWLELVLLAAVMCANARPFTYDRQVSLAYADYSRLPPQSIRAPVKVSEAARALGIPYPTARRHAEAMLRDGRLTRVRDGLMVSDNWLSRPLILEDSNAANEHTRQIFGRLAAGGFRFDDPATCYIRGRPPLLAFE